MNDSGTVRGERAIHTQTIERSWSIFRKYIPELQFVAIKGKTLTFSARRLMLVWWTAVLALGLCLGLIGDSLAQSKWPSPPPRPEPSQQEQSHPGGDQQSPAPNQQAAPQLPPIINIMPAPKTEAEAAEAIVNKVGVTVQTTPSIGGTLTLATNSEFVDSDGNGAIEPGQTMRGYRIASDVLGVRELQQIKSGEMTLGIIFQIVANYIFQNPYNQIFPLVFDHRQRIFTRSSLVPEKNIEGDIKALLAQLRHSGDLSE